MYQLQNRQRWDRLTVSVVLHVVGVIALTEITGKLPQQPQFRPVDTAQSIALVTPLDLIARSNPVEPPPTPVIKRPPMPAAQAPPIKAPPPRLMAKLQPPRPAPVPAPTLEASSPKTALPEPVKPSPQLAAAPPPRKVAEIKPTPFGGGGSSAPPTIKRPVSQVQTGGFGDPNGVPGQGHKDAKDAKVTIASLGSFDLPGGRGSGNGSGGTHGVRGTVASAGFGNGMAGAGSGNGSGPGTRGGTVASAGFADATAADSPSPARARTEVKPQVTPVEITYKPRPAYSDEARRLHLEGEVLLNVMFSASGQLRVVRVVRGLGHGLDQAALQAAEQIRFRPARRNGEPFDSEATVHIVFELAE